MGVVQLNAGLYLQQNNRKKEPPKGLPKEGNVLFFAGEDGHAEGGESEICVDAVGEGVADDLLCAKVFHNSAVEPALAGGDIGNIADPCGVWLVKGEAARKEIGRDGVRVS